MIGKLELLIDTNAKAGDSTEGIDSRAANHEDRRIHFVNLIPCTETGELQFTGV